MTVLRPRPGDADATYVHSQNTPATTWTVHHNLGKWPSVDVVDSGGRQVIATVVHLSTSTLEVRTSAPFGGRAFCN